ncbi:MAG: ATP synthase F0 subunit C [Planctomycetota bacterium]
MDIAVVGALLGSGICMGLGSLANGTGIGYVAVGALRGWVRQPKVSAATFRLMLVGQAGASTPSIFALVVSLVLLIKMADPRSLAAPDSWPQAMAFVATGLAVGIASLGSGYGCGLVGSSAVETSARIPRQTGKIMLYMLVGQAWGQTPNILALVIGLILLFTQFPAPAYPQFIGEVGRLLGVGICIGAGAIGPALGIGYVGAKYCRALGDNPRFGDSTIRTVFFVGAAVSETTTIYAFLIALILLFE